MKLAYVIGPYRDERGLWYIEQNIHRAKLLAIKLWRNGYSVLCPHCNSGLMDGGASDKQFLAGDLAWLQFADVAFVVPSIPGLKDVDDSIGSVEEIQFCQDCKIPVIRTSYDGAGNAILIPDEWRYGDERRDCLNHEGAKNGEGYEKKQRQKR